MKKLLFGAIGSVCLVLNGCSLQQSTDVPVNPTSVKPSTSTNIPVPKQSEPTITSNTGKVEIKPVIDTSAKLALTDLKLFEKNQVYNPIKPETYKFTWKMNKPQLEEMNNWKYLLSGYHEQFSTKYTFTKDDEVYKGKNNDGNDNCEKVTFYDKDTYQPIQSVKANEIQVGKQIDIKGQYAGSGFCQVTYNFKDTTSVCNGGDEKLFNFAKIKKFLQEHGWAIYNPGLQYTNYEGDGLDPQYKYIFKEEWINYYSAIGGKNIKSDRYPYNTVFISSDLLLHIFHILFDNNLKYYEESVMRKQIANISQSMYQKFTNLYTTTTDANLKKHYEFLAGYWTIATSILTDEKHLLLPDAQGSLIESGTSLNILIADVFKKNISFMPVDKQKIWQAELDKILAANNEKIPDLVLEAYYPDLFKIIDLKQDYSQFQPRSHYTSSVLLKTYFIGLKWLMREKFYFADKNLALTSIIQTNNIDKNNIKLFTNMFEFTKKLIGQDDDINIFDLQNFIKSKNFASDSDILTKWNEGLQQELQKMKPQNIISTSYNTANIQEKSEQEAHDQTAGFVFFGEKTVIDSWMYDQLSAGSTEKESERKPPVVTALSAPAILNNNALAQQLVKLRLDQQIQKKTVKSGQALGYQEDSQQLIEKVKYFNFEKNIYHKWLDLLNYLFIKTDANNPYFYLDPIYQYKQLITYMGSYTELKHDTLLYVKQAYAEMGGGGGDCNIFIEVPALPVPKGYVEPNVELIDQLIKLSTQVNMFYQTSTGSNFVKYIEYLNFLKKIAIAETKNETISDADFDKLRLSYVDLFDLMIPMKYIGLPLQKEERGALIADIFTSENFGPLYEATGRPNLLLLMIKDVNGSRIVLGPIFTHYEFYGSDSPIETTSRLTDENWQNKYDALSGTTNIYGLEMEQLMSSMNNK